ncbi:phosphotransferase enzyme family protein [Myceligenerans pegani]|uniref:Phosphotransferase n=1 Tax=Myceligenerans pegani TaxID=2776917 RepID=A0ABR9N3L1_9MICO|nr:phosphotransferase [Myceligenerans sp. TRM 65318]MBE1878250.1 phosphotransferase [Myceligenerans sp. TRM 65318]MBE3020521.1 phosphotransferase [Myceligenerans sp. TRM 65318]
MPDFLAASPPSLSMLWESADPSEALARRFRFDSPTAAVSWLSEVIAQHWGRTLDSCERLVISSGNMMAWITVGDRRMIAKWSMHAPVFTRLAAIARLTRWLDQRGLPVSPPQPAQDGSLQLEVDGVSLGLQNVVPGDLLDVSDVTQVRAAGEMLATLHTALAAYPSVVPTAEPPRSGTQLVGNDFRSANILWAGGGISAILDLEEARYERRVDDLAKAAAYLGTRYHDWKPTPPDARDSFVAAYQAVHPLPEDQLDEARAIIAEHVAGWPH